MVFCYSSPNRLRPWLHIEIAQGTFKSPNAQATSQTNLIRIYGGSRINIVYSSPDARRPRLPNITFPSMQGPSAPLLLTCCS